MNAKALAVVIYFVINIKSCQAAQYSNYSLVAVNPVTRDQLKFLHSLESQRYMAVNFCKKPYKLGQPVEVVVSPVDIEFFKERAEHFDLEYAVLLNNIQEAFDSQSIKRYLKFRPETFTFDDYHWQEDIHQWLTDLYLSNSSIMRHFSIGFSAGGRDISVVNINFDNRRRKEKVIVEGGIHGHEWASVAFVTYLINELFQARSSSDGVWRRLAEAYDWFLIPILNPDGYDYTQKKDRLWRKNRNGTGVDLNRNFDESFGKFGSSSDPKSDNYCGPKPFSEPETKALAAFIEPLKGELRYYFAIHAYGQRILIPYEDRVQHLENYGEMESYSRQAVRKVYLKNHVKYATGTLYDTIGARISGTSASWVKKQMKVKFVYTIQVRDDGTYGYALPDEQLIPMCEETKLIIKELMTAKPRYVRALFAEDSSVNTLINPFMLLGILVTLVMLE